MPYKELHLCKANPNNVDTTLHNSHLDATLFLTHYYDSINYLFNGIKTYSEEIELLFRPTKEQHNDGVLVVLSSSNDGTLVKSLEKEANHYCSP